jgi:2-amino-4-hydroxy-6-hydroxymethyldihydropteridine diphosphokinase
MIYIGIGSNLGNRISNIEKAKYLLNLNGVKIVKKSNYYESLSWPNPTKPKFINIVVKSNSNFSPKKLIKIFQLIEKKLGRKKSIKNSPRTCDIDLISYNQKVLSGPIMIPHKMMHKRNFVLIPLYELDKNWVHPITNFSIRKLIFSLPINEITSIKQI